MFFVSERLCVATKGTLDGAFLTTLLHASSVGLLVLSWVLSTEASWDDDPGSFEFSCRSTDQEHRSKWW